MTYVCDDCGREWSEKQYNNYIQHRTDSHSLDGGESYIERYRRIKSEIPEKYHESYEELTGSGRGPRTVQAAVCYIESSATQDEVTEIFDISDVAIREMVQELIDRGVVALDEVRENCSDNGLQKFGERRDQGESGEYDHDDIREMRNRNNLTKRGFAERLNVSTATIRAWEEEDAHNPSPPMAEKIREEMGV